MNRYWDNESNFEERFGRLLKPKGNKEIKHHVVATKSIFRVIFLFNNFGYSKKICLESYLLIFVF